MWAISRGSNAQILFHPLTSSLADGVLWRDPSAHPCFDVLELLLQCSCKVLKSFVCRAGDWVTYLEWSCKESMNKREEKNDKSNRWNLWVLRGNFSLFFSDNKFPTLDFSPPSPASEQSAGKTGLLGGKVSTVVFFFLLYFSFSST